MMRQKLIILLNFVMVVLCIDANEHKFVIDNDAGADDAMAIFLSLLYEKHFNGPQLIGLTTANGNTNEDNVSINNQKILRKAKRQDVPIYRGARSALVTTPERTDYFGKDGLGDNDEPLEGLVAPKDQGAVDALIELSKKHEGNLTVITLGTLTNIALALRIDPDFLSRLAHLYVGAGHIESEKYPTAEFNVHMDVEAYHVIAQHATPDKVTVLPYSQVLTYLNISKDWRLNTFGAIDTEIIKALDVYERVTLPRLDDWANLDPAVVTLALSNIVNKTEINFVTEYKYSKNDIIICGEKRGINTNNFVNKENANVRMAYAFDIDKYKAFLLEVFSADKN